MAYLTKIIRDRSEVVRSILSHPMRGAGRMETLRRYAMWNLLRSGIDANVVFRLPGDLRIIAPSRSNLSTGLALGQVDPNLLFLANLARPDDWVCDIGANIGIYGLLIARLSGCHILGCEPVPSTFSILSDNVRLNRLEDRVELHNVALGDREGSALMTDGLHGLNHVVESGGIKVPMHTLDSVIGDRRPVALKIDTEGYEAFILQGAARTLASEDLLAVYIEIKGHEERYGERANDPRAILVAHGFETMHYDPATRELLPGHGEGVDQIMVRRPDIVRERLRLAPPIEVGGQRY